MSIASEISRLQTAKANLKTSIENKGVTVPSSTLLSGYSALVDQISGGGGGVVNYETGTYTPTSDTIKPTISFSNPHNTLPILAIMIDTTTSFNYAANTNVSVVVIYFETAIGTLTQSSTVKRYGQVMYTYKTTSSSVSNSSVMITYPATNTTNSTTSYPRYWFTESSFMPSSGSSNRSWVAGHTYRWIAVWQS